MNFIEAIQSGFENYANFSGRTQPSGYWWWVAFGILAGIVAKLFDSALGTAGVIGLLQGLALLLPGWAVLVRRLHDVDKSGWNWLWALTIVGIIYVLYLLVQPGTPGPNRFGEDPRLRPMPSAAV